ncbi:MCE family protein [Rhodococcus sp. D2-41]|uniref:MCE family protein n=1 Tax=Speluncibacter jeojiensis TaxID=2710754 RepID=UPI00240F5ABB|nr:MlaD family protein [Rhodococcus sp. D2-41]MDG3012578.1 MCE family protein [Rhodococcus sp. D2-41]
MTTNLRAVGWRLAIFVTVMVTVLGGLVLVLGQYRFDDYTRYEAVFTDASGLKKGDFIRVAGVETGKVAGVRVDGADHAVVEMDVDSSYPLTTATRAVVRYANLVGDRYLALLPGPDSAQRLPAGARLGTDRTAPALNLDQLLGSFKPLFRALDPKQVNSLTQELIAVFQGEGGTVQDILAHTASLTNTIADRDEVVGQVVTNLNTVLGTVAGRDQDLSSALDKAQQLTGALAADNEHWGAALTRIDSGAAAVADLLTDARTPLQGTVGQLRRTASQLDSGKQTLDSVITRLPTAYAALSRLGAYGNFFNYYLCGLRIKFTGADGSDVSTPMFGQTTGRCAPK